MQILTEERQSRNHIFDPSGPRSLHDRLEGFCDLFPTANRDQLSPRSIGSPQALQKSLCQETVRMISLLSHAGQSRLIRLGMSVRPYLWIFVIGTIQWAPRAYGMVTPLAKTFLSPGVALGLQAGATAAGYRVDASNASIIPCRSRRRREDCLHCLNGIFTYSIEYE